MLRRMRQAGVALEAAGSRQQAFSLRNAPHHTHTATPTTSRKGARLSPQGLPKFPTAQSPLSADL